MAPRLKARARHRLRSSKTFSFNLFFRGGKTKKILKYNKIFWSLSSFDPEQAKKLQQKSVTNLEIKDYSPGRQCGKKTFTFWRSKKINLSKMKLTWKPAWNWIPTDGRKDEFLVEKNLRNKFAYGLPSHQDRKMIVAELFHCFIGQPVRDNIEENKIRSLKKTRREVGGEK